MLFYCFHRFKSNDIITNAEQNVTTNKLSWGDLFPQVNMTV